jgi:pimeloyl-ACP methyl ester carboxylesterase
MGDQLSHFTSESARERFLAAYDEAMKRWPEHRTLDLPTEYGMTRVWSAGSDPRPPIVLLHGSQGTSANWWRMIHGLCADRSVYAIDTIDDPGGSVQTVDAKEASAKARWLDQVLDQLPTSKVHLVGVSYGGWLALNQAVRGSSRLQSVVLLDPGGLEKVPASFYAQMLLGLPAAVAPKRLRPWLARRLANPALVEPPDQLKPVMLAARTWRANRPAAAVVPDEELRTIDVPMLIVLAQRSVLLKPERARQRAEKEIPGIRTILMPGVGHGLILEEPNEVNRHILEFIATHEAAG